MTDAELIAMAYSRAAAPMIDLFEAVVEQSDGAALQMARDLFHIISLFPGKGQRDLILRAVHQAWT